MYIEVFTYERQQLFNAILYDDKFRIHHSGRKNELLTNCRTRPEISTAYTARDAHVEPIEISRIISIALIIYTITSRSCKRGS